MSLSQPQFAGTAGRLAAALLVGMLAAGCHARKQYTEVLNQEKRALEDELYDLAYDYEILLDKYKRLCEVHGAAPQGASLEELPAGDRRPALSRQDQQQRDDTSGAGAAGDQAPPPIPVPEQDDARPGPAEVPPLTPPNVEPGDTEAGAGELPPPTDAGIGRVASIRLNSVRTGGDDFDETPGDDGVSVLIEPRGTRGEIIARPAQLAIVVLDPAEPKERARIARWDLTEQEAAQHVRHSGGQRGIYLQLPWPERRPRNSRLHLFVRYVTPDGRKLEADREFFVNVHGEVANRWTPRSAQRRRMAQARRQREAAREAAGSGDSPPQQPIDLSPPPPASGDASPGRSESSVTDPPVRQVERPRWKPVR